MGTVRWVAFVLTACAAWGCQADPVHGQSPASRQSTAATTSPATVDPQAPVPPGLPADRLMPWRGNDLQRARKTLDQVLADLPRPAFLAAAATVPGPVDVKAMDPPLAAQHAFLQGFEAWRAGHLFEARRQIEIALTLTPNDPYLLKMLGQIWAASGNRTQSAQYLERAMASDPNDIDTALLLGRQALEQGRSDVAISVFAHAMRQSGQDSTEAGMVKPLAAFYLGSALESAGYDLASVTQMKLYLDQPEPTTRSHPLARKLAILSRQSGLLWLSVGDSNIRLGRFAEAVDAYTRAQAEDGADPQQLLARLVLAHILDGHPEQAEKALEEAINRDAKADPPVDLTRWAVAKGVSGSRLAASYQRLYEQRGRPSRMALVIAELLGGKAGQAFLEQHLKLKPDDQAVFSEWLQGPSDTRKPVATVAEAEPLVKRTLAAIDAAPDHATEYAGALIARVNNANLLLKTVDHLGAEAQARPMTRFLKAGLLMQNLQFTAARQELEAVIHAQPAFRPARTRLATLLVAQRKYDQAVDLLKPLENDPDAEVALLRVQILAETGHADQAVDLVTRMLDKEPASIPLLLQKARLLMIVDQASAAERLLLDAINVNPTSELLYESLFNLYETGKVADAGDQYQRLMRRMLGTIPQSRLARIKLSEMHAAQQDFTSAERLLQSVLREDPADPRAIAHLLDLFRVADRQDDAEKLIREQIEPSGRPDLLAIARGYYEQKHNVARMNELEERIYQQMPPGVPRAARLSEFYLRLDKPRQAVAVLQEAMVQFAPEADDATMLASMLGRAMCRADKADQVDAMFTDMLRKHPDQDAELRLAWASNLEMRDKYDRGEAMLVESLKKHPDHAPTLNALGYGWANRGRNLEQAKAMIEQALAAEPDSAAYLDSLAWVMYKLGRFKDAVRLLKQATHVGGGDHPVILDHLGDASYRVGEAKEADQYWRQAQQLMQEPSLRSDEDPDLKNLDKRLENKLESLRKGQISPVADSTVPLSEGAVLKSTPETPGGLMPQGVPAVPAVPGVPGVPGLPAAPVPMPSPDVPEPVQDNPQP
ncbi:MAG: tetratricopeptide repeat protein [Phycisphaeraceae bacterium]|nr:tetratricopeptide repeat protein [Phycisphaeraceae bacterium]